MGNWTPSIVPPGTDQTVYLVLNDFGRRGRSFLETDEEKADLETILTNLLSGEYSAPVKVIGFNAAEGWARDVSEDVADELRQRLALQDDQVPLVLGGLPRSTHNRPDRRQLRLV
jgi:uncharacterized membrane protein